VGGNPDRAGISIKAPHIPQNMVVVRANNNQGLLFMAEVNMKHMDKFRNNAE